MNKNFIVFILTLGVFSIINTEMGVVGMIPLVAQKYSVSVGDAGWVVSAFALAVAICAPILPLLCSRFERKKLMLAVLGVFTAGNLLATFTDSFALLLGVRVVQGALHPIYVAMAFSVAAASAGEKDAPKAVGKVFAGVSAGMVLGVSITGFVADKLGLEAATAFFALVNFIVFVATAFFVPTITPASALSYGSQIGVLRRPLVLIGVFSALALNAAMFGYFSFMADYLNSFILISLSLASAVLFVYGVGSIAGNVLSGRLLAGEKTGENAAEISGDAAELSANLEGPNQTSRIAAKSGFKPSFHAKIVRRNLLAVPIITALIYALLYAFGAAHWLLVAAILAALGVAVGVGPCACTLFEKISRSISFQARLPMRPTLPTGCF